MTAELSTHLSEEAINDVLIGLGSAEAKAHLSVCAACRSQVEAVRAGIQAFNAATLAHSEHRAVRIQAAVARSWYRRQSLLQYGLTVAAALLLVISLPIGHFSSPSTHITPPSETAEPENSESQIAQDNELLRSVDAALSTADASPESDYHLIVVTHPAHRLHSEARN